MSAGVHDVCPSGGFFLSSPVVLALLQQTPLSLCQAYASNNLSNVVIHPSKAKASGKQKEFPLLAKTHNYNFPLLVP